jgi:hypothetical protein
VFVGGILEEIQAFLQVWVLLLCLQWSLPSPKQELLPQEILSGTKFRQEKKFSVGPIDDDDDDDDDDGDDI